MKNPLSAFQDDEGNTSSKRIQSFMCFFTAIAIGIGSLFIDPARIDGDMVIGLVWAFVVAGAALQGITIFQEKR